MLYIYNIQQQVKLTGNVETVTYKNSNRSETALNRGEREQQQQQILGLLYMKDSLL